MYEGESKLWKMRVRGTEQYSPQGIWEWWNAAPSGTSDSTMRLMFRMWLWLLQNNKHAEIIALFQRLSPSLLVWLEACHPTLTTCWVLSLMTLSERTKWLSAQISRPIGILPISVSRVNISITRFIFSPLSSWDVAVHFRIHPAAAIHGHITSIKPRESVALAAVHARGTVFHRWGGIHASHTQQTWLACFTQLSLSFCFKQMQHTINHFLQLVRCSNPMSNTVTTYCTHSPNLSKLGKRVPHVPQICSSTLWVRCRKPYIVTQRCIFLVSLKPWH